MIKLARLSGFVLLLSATGAIANPIIVRSGDHSGFTRLVMQLPENVQWQLNETRGLKTITVSDHDEGFDTRRVFDIIPRDQLTDVRSYPSRLELELSCECELSTFVERDEFLVIDIIDGPTLPPLEMRQAPRFVSARPASRFNYGDLLWSEFSSFNDENEVVSVSTPDPRASIELEELDESAAAPERIDQTREQLLLGIVDASSRGILQPATPDLQIMNELDTSLPTEEIFDSSEQITVAQPIGSANIRVTNSRDVPTSVTSSTDLSIASAVCADPRRVMVPGWGSHQPFHSQITQARNALYSEIGELDPDGAEALARMYLFFGLGAEAKQVLRLSETLAAQSPELIDLADIMEHGFARNPRFVHRFSDCDSALALWSIMAAKTIPDGQFINQNAALLALAALPDHLKAFIAPALSKRLAGHGDLEAASIALRHVEISNNDPAADADLARAKIEQGSGNTGESDGLLSQVIEESTTETPEALIALIDNGLGIGRAVPADIALLIETYAFELRNGPLAEEIQRAHVIASAYSEQYAKSFEALANQEIKNNEELTSELQSHIFSALASNADDFTFLDSFYAEFPSSAENLMQKTVTQTARRLLKLGFATNALDVLTSVPSSRRTDELRLLHAETLMALEDADAALRMISDIGSEDASVLRARAYLELGNNQAAFDLFQETNAVEDALRSAWLADEWADMVPRETPVLGDIRMLAEQPVSQIEPENGMLATSSSALEQSATARATLEGLLQGFIVAP